MVCIPRASGSLSIHLLICSSNQVGDLLLHAFHVLFLASMLLCFQLNE